MSICCIWACIFLSNPGTRYNPSWWQNLGWFKILQTSSKNFGRIANRWVLIVESEGGTPNTYYK